MDGPGITALTRTQERTAGAVPALAVEAVSHAYGARRALNEVSFAVPTGGFVALLGPNGAGKTTLLSLVSRLFDTRHGRIRVQGFDIARQPGAALAELGVVFQARTLDLDLTVRDNLLYHAALHGMGLAAARARVAAVLRDVDLSDRARDKARQLSGGQMRRVEIARALVHEPSVLVLDEPTVGLDVASKAAILEQVRGLSCARHVAVLWATHLLDEIEPGDSVIVLHAGRVLAQGSPADIVAAAGAADLRSAFRILTGIGPASADEAGGPA
ncbi:MAG: ATP-binding cassette domain-containing protein [Rhodospirillales bacterium]|nr:ATP-binding cassette domain-containing protein [Rhodospirillales bacterium]